MTIEPLLTIDELVRELDQPNLTGWKLFAQADGLSVYRRPEDKLIRYKCFQTISDISPEIYFKVGQDIQYRLVWDKYLKEAKEIRDGDKTGIYWQIIMPLFIDNRDYTFVRESNELDINDRHYFYAMTRCEPFSTEPVRKKVIRVDVCQSQSLICSDGANGLKCLFIYSEEPRGNIPTAVWAWGAKFGVPYYAKVTLNACKNYSDWLKTHKIPPMVVVDDEAEKYVAATTEIGQ